MDVPPKENPDDDDEVNVEPNGDLLGCQLDPNKVELGPLLELTELTAKEEAEVPSPKDVAGLEEGNNEFPERKAALAAGLDEGNEELLEKGVFPDNPKDEEDADEPNETDWV